MRGKVGDVVAVFDGHGREAVARVEAIKGRAVVIRAIEAREGAAEPSIALTLGQAVLKSEQMDRVVRDTVMMGVAAIRPLLTARTEIPKAALKGDARQDHLQRTALSSVKQCGRTVVPPVAAPQTFQQFLRAERDVLSMMFVEPGGAPAERLVDLRAFETRVPAKATLLIGPVGGWDAAEVTAAEAAGITLVTLGARTLRADIAATIAIAVLQYVWKDF